MIELYQIFNFVEINFKYSVAHCQNLAVLARFKSGFSFFEVLVGFDNFSNFICSSNLKNLQIGIRVLNSRFSHVIILSVYIITSL